MGAYLRPARIEEALAALGQSRHLVLAGGTDIYPTEANAAGWGQPSLTRDDRPNILDITSVNGLNQITVFADRVEIGARVTWTQAIQSELGQWFDGVRLAAREVGGRQIQNRGTLVGNLCNASPAADGVPALMALDAKVRLDSASAQRELSLGDFILGNRKTALAEHELVSAIIIPMPASHARSTFLKLGARRYLVISIAMVAVTAVIVDKIIDSIAIAIGACSAVAQRLPLLEQRLKGCGVSQAERCISDADFHALQPIDDIRGSGEYRRHAAKVLVRRAVAQLDENA
ncbi:MAG: xanthine dehydrogenase family protein subunit M [Chromatiales bacterium]|jgi:CO/xanthine dehydrogenase FAD-binding subunit|nr:xanthine dehydrogenase family protein subunit M [Chromatiales bacterium]